MIDNILLLYEKSIVKIFRTDRDWGTGFFISPSHILTCAHVVKDQETVDVLRFPWHPPSSTEKARITRCTGEIGNDCAVLKLSESNSDFYVVFDDEYPQKLDPLHFFGFPACLEEGRPGSVQYEGIGHYKGNDLLTLSKGQIDAGTSGAPILNLRTNKVCGMLAMSIDYDSDLGGYAVPVRTIDKELDKLKVRRCDNGKWQYYIDKFSVPLPARSDQKKVPVRVRRPYYSIPYSKNIFFTGRKDVIKRLDHEINKYNISIIGQPQILSGLGGIGKTQIALEYISQIRKKYSYVFWIHAESRESITAGYYHMAQIANIPASLLNDSTEIINFVKSWLEEERKTFLVFDNADNPHILKQFLPDNFKGKVLITSRADNFSFLGIRDVIKINNLSFSDSVDFMMKRTGKTGVSSDEKDALEKLIRELDFFPLALEQASAFIGQCGYRFSEYLEEYKLKKIKLLSMIDPQSSEYSKNIDTVWDLNINEIKNKSRLAYQLLCLSAFLYPENIPFELYVQAEELMTDGKTEDDKKRTPIKLALSYLRNFSLLSGDKDFKTFTIHRMVQEVLKSKLGPEERKYWVCTALEYLNRILPDFSFKTWERYNQLSYQIDYVLNVYGEYGITNPEIFRLSLHAARYYKFLGNKDFAGKILADARSVKKTAVGCLLKNTQPDIDLVCRELKELIGILIEAEEFDEARLYQKQEINYLNEIPEINPVVLARSYTIYATLERINDKKRTKIAQRYFEKALRIIEVHLPDDHPDKANFYLDFADFQEDLQEYALAETYYHKAESIWNLDEFLYVEELAKLYNNLARLKRKQKQPDKAREYYEKALAILDIHAGEMDPKKAGVYNNLGYLFTEMKKWDDAEEYIQKALNIYIALFGREHHDVIAVINNLNNLNVQRFLKQKKSEVNVLQKHGVPPWKRVLDIALSVSMLVASLPILVITSVFIKIVSPGPVLFRQTRIGYRGRQFIMYKFRTMRKSSYSSIHMESFKEFIADDKRLSKLDSGMDPRLIPGARFLRRMAIDELPQLFNVLSGSMSFIGPRPCLPYEAHEYNRWHRLRFETPPGMTGLWQIGGREKLSFNQMIRLDIRYIQNLSLGLDLKIFLSTLGAIVVLFARSCARGYR